MKLEAKFSDGAVRLAAKFREMQIVEVGKEEDLDTVLDAQGGLIDELKGVLAGKASGGKAAVIEPLEVTANGEFTAPDGVDGYSPVVVSVPVPDGYIQPEGTLEVNENGTHDVTAYASVDVNVQAGGDTAVEDAILSNTIGGTYTNDRIKYLGGYHFVQSKTLEAVSLPNVESTGTNTFQQCPILKSVSMPKLARASNYLCYGCPMITQLDFPSLTAIGTAAFQACTGLIALILRKPTLCKLENANALTRTPIAEGTGYIYVPRSYLSDDDATMDYRRATNWPTYAAQFRALEDYTVDGTITGELDPAKVGG